MMLKMVKIYLLLLCIGKVNLKKHVKYNRFPWPSSFPPKYCDGGVREDYIRYLEDPIESHLFLRRQCLIFYKDYPCPDLCDVSNITVLLYNKYIEAEENNFVNITEFDVLSKDMDNFKYVDQMLFMKTLYLLAETMAKGSEKNADVFIDISRKLSYVKHKYQRDYFNFFSRFLFALEMNTTIINQRFVFKGWNPFQSNITGYSLYNNASNHGFSVKHIFRNQSSENVDVENLQIAGYIPYELLSELVQGVSAEIKEKFHVVMLLVVDDPKIRNVLQQPDDLKYFIGIAIPGFCKMNELPLLTAFFKSQNGLNSGHWIEFGKNYFDSLRFPPEYCILNRLSFFGPTGTNVRNYYESPAKDYCLSITRNVGNFSAIWEQTPVGNIVYPRNFCISGNLKIPNWRCHQGGHFRPNWFHRKDSKCVHDLPISNNTENLFHLFTSCGDKHRNCKDHNLNNSFNFIDAKLHLQYLVERYYGPERDIKIYETIEESLVLLEAKRNRYPQITYLSLLMIEIFHSNRFVSKHTTIIIKSNYIYDILITQRTHANGVAIHKRGNDSFLDYKVKLLTAEDGDLPYNNSVEVVIKFSNSTMQKFADRYPGFQYFIIHNNNFTENENFVCKSRIVGIHVLCCRYYQEPVEFDVYLKSVGSWDTWSTSYDNIENYSTKIEVQPDTLVVFCISIPKNDPCDSSSKLFILRMNIYSYKGNGAIEIDVRSRTVEKIDILSQLAMSLNPGSRQMHEKHSAIFKMVTRICCILSSIGFFCIFISSLLLKSWYKKRMNTIQLSIAQTFQIVFILIGHSDISHVGYLLFYYSILSQFSWMSIIGYLQYLKFVKIFGDFKLTITKSIVLGWLVPAVIILTSMLFHMDCFKCNLCYKNDRIFTYFVIVPISLVIVGNFAVYIAVIASILRSKSTPKMKKTVLRAAVLLPFVMGISWIFIAALVTPWSWITLTGSYLFHTVASLQGFILFVFTVVLDKDTRSRWWNFVRLIFRRKDTAHVGK